MGVSTVPVAATSLIKSVMTRIEESATIHFTNIIILRYAMVLKKKATSHYDHQSLPSNTID